MQRLDGYIQEAIVKVQQQNIQGAATAFGHYQDDWFDIEDGVKSIWKTTLPQLALVTLTIAVVWYTHQKTAGEQSASL